MSAESLREFLGWCTVINIGVMLWSVIMIAMLRDRISGLHAKIFGLEKSEVKLAYFQFLANYKIAVIVFCLVPYLALLIMT